MDSIALPVVSLIEERDFPKEKVMHGDGKIINLQLKSYLCALSKSNKIQQKQLLSLLKIVSIDNWGEFFNV